MKPSSQSILSWKWRLGSTAAATVKDPKGQPTTLRQTLLQDYTLNRANRKIMGGLAELMAQGEQRNRLMELVDNSDSLNEYLSTRDYVDILREFDEAKFESPEAFLAQLSPVVPRLYSIASSLQFCPLCWACCRAMPTKGWP